MLTVSHVCRPIEFAISRLLAGDCGSIAKVSRWGLRKPYAQISGRAPGVATNGLSFGTRYRPFSLTTLDDSWALRSGMMRWILPTIVARRCGLVRIACRDSPEPPSPQAT